MPLLRKSLAVQSDSEAINPKAGQPDLKSPVDDELAKERNRLSTIRLSIEVRDF